MPKFAAALILACLALISPANAQTDPRPTTDIALVLAVDASGSVNRKRFELQRQGYAEAFREPRVLDAILGLSTRSIAVTMVQWTGPAMQVQVVPWTLIKDKGTAGAFADAIQAAPREFVRRRHLAERRHRPRQAAAGERALSRVEARHRHFRRRRQQSRPRPSRGPR